MKMNRNEMEALYAFGCPNLKATVERLRMVAALAPDPVAKKLFYMLSVKLSAEGVERWYRCFYCKLRVLKNHIPVYKHSASYAREHDELAAYRASNQANTACKEAIEAAIRDHYRDNRLDAAAVDQVVQQFGYDRAFYILAITVCQADWDRRYSPDNRAWANAMSIPANPDAWGTDRNCYLAVSSHPGLVDLFLSQTRKAYAQERQKTSVRDKLKKPPETTSPKISAKSKAPER
nr:DUF3849 domain-containing protein [Mediterraneibacter faecis]